MHKRSRLNHLQARTFKFMRAVEKRVAPRYECEYPWALLGWNGDGSFQSRPALIVDFSMTGIKLEIDWVPPTKHPLFVALDTSESTGWIPLTTIACDEIGRGKYELRATFAEPCDYDFFKAVVYGIEN